MFLLCYRTGIDAEGREGGKQGQGNGRDGSRKNDVLEGF